MAAPVTGDDTPDWAQMMRWRWRLKRFLDRPLVQRMAARLYAAYAKFVVMTSRVTFYPADYLEIGQASRPIIVALWHGEATLALFTPRLPPPIFGMTSRSRDGEIVAQLMDSAGMTPIRASGGGQRRQGKRRGGVAGMLTAIDALKSGGIVAVTADVHGRPGRTVGPGVVALSRHSGAPVRPIAAASSRHLRLRRTWDRSAIPLPFGRIAFVLGTPVAVAAEADADAQEAARLSIEAELTRIQRLAYDLVGVVHG